MLSVVLIWPLVYHTDQEAGKETPKIKSVCPSLLECVICWSVTKLTSPGVSRFGFVCSSYTAGSLSGMFLDRCEFIESACTSSASVPSFDSGCFHVVLENIVFFEDTKAD